MASIEARALRASPFETVHSQLVGMLRHSAPLGSARSQCSRDSPVAASPRQCLVARSLLWQAVAVFLSLPPRHLAYGPLQSPPRLPRAPLDWLRPSRPPGRFAAPEGETRPTCGRRCAAFGKCE